MFLYILLITAAHSVFGASIEHVIPRAADMATLTHESSTPTNEAPSKECIDKTKVYIEYVDEYYANWEKWKGINKGGGSVSLSFWYDFFAEVPYDDPPEWVNATWLTNFSVVGQMLEENWTDRWEWQPLSLAEALCAAFEMSGAARSKNCIDKTKVYIEYVDEYYAKWEKWKNGSKVRTFSLLFWDDFFAETPLNHPVELQSVFKSLVEDRWMNSLEWPKVSLEQRLCVILEHTTPITTTEPITVRTETTEPLNMCLLRTKACIRYFDMFKHYEAWQRYKWVHVYGFIGEYAGIEDYLWDDFLVDAPYDYPGFEDIMGLLRKASKWKDRLLWDDDRLAEVLCEEHYSFTEDESFQFFHGRDEYAYHYLGYYDYYQGHDVFDDDPLY